MAKLLTEEQYNELIARLERAEQLADALVEWKHCMSYNDSYFSEPAGWLKRAVFAYDRKRGGK